ncbi:hypothetical protein GCM10009836_73730 [Pseudonocardia ailaonensis]|uniref:Uncharacterized protein n=1 Tax=Pseudonocardia ailaonensis TaxID=367279 RepID=A0ABN2NQD2_9PSEU
MTATEPTALPDAQVRGTETPLDDPTVAIPVVPAAYGLRAPWAGGTLAGASPEPPVAVPGAVSMGAWPGAGPKGAGPVSYPVAGPAAPIADPYGPPAGLGYPPPYGHPGFAAPRRSRRPLAIVGGVVGVALLAGVVAAAASGGTQDVRGTFELTDTGYLGSSFRTGSSCTGSGGYRDIGAGTGVTVYDASGAIVGTGRLSTGRATSSSTCEFTFTVPDVPTGGDFYQVEISHRGKVTVDADELANGPALTLGS